MNEEQMREERRQLERRVDDKIKDAVMDAIKHLHCMHEQDWGSFHEILAQIKVTCLENKQGIADTLAQTMKTNGRTTVNEQQIKSLKLIGKTVAWTVGAFLLIFFPDSPVGKLLSKLFGG